MRKRDWLLWSVLMGVGIMNFATRHVLVGIAFCLAASVLGLYCGLRGKDAR